MTMRRPVLALAMVLGACAGGGERGPAARPVVSVEPAPTGWRALASEPDVERIATLPAQWSRALAAVPPRLRRRAAAETELLAPAAAQPMPTPPPGPYRCRLVRLGGPVGFASFAPDFCYVDGDGERLSFTKQTGQNLPGGWLHPDTPGRLVFLGAVPPAGSKAVPLYGRHPAQDIAGVVERVSPFRWRLVLTRAGRGAIMDIYELVPVTPAVPGAKPAVPARG